MQKSVEYERNKFQEFLEKQPSKFFALLNDSFIVLYMLPGLYFGLVNMVHMDVRHPHPRSSTGPGSKNKCKNVTKDMPSL